MLLTPLPLLPQAKKKAASKGQKAALRKGGPGEASALRFDIDEDSDKSVAEQLRDALIENSVRVVDLFKDWDDDQSGTVTRDEFHKAMDEMQFNVPKEAIDALFSEWDPDNSGALELRELERLLKRRVQIADNLQAGAMGEIEQSSDNKVAPRPAPRAPRPAPRAPSLHLCSLSPSLLTP